MSTVDLTRARTALAPLRADIVGRAESDAAQLLAEAQAEADAERDRAEADAAAITARARADGKAEAEAALAADRAHARQVRRAALLAAQNAAYQQLRHDLAASLASVRAAPDYPDLCAQLRAAAVSILGPDATIIEPPAGGIIATAGGRRIDLSLPSVAEGALVALQPELGGLWS